MLLHKAPEDSAMYYISMFAFHSNISNGLYEFVHVSSLVLLRLYVVFLDFKYLSTLNSYVLLLTAQGNRNLHCIMKVTCHFSDLSTVIIAHVRVILSDKFVQHWILFLTWQFACYSFFHQFMKLL